MRFFPFLTQVFKQIIENKQFFCLSHNGSYVSNEISEATVVPVDGTTFEDITSFADDYSDIFTESGPDSVGIPNCVPSANGYEGCIVNCTCNQSKGWYASTSNVGALRIAARTTRAYAYTLDVASSTPTTLTCYHSLCNEDQGYFYYSDPDNQKDTNVFDYDMQPTQSGSNRHCLKPRCKAPQLRPGSSNQYYFYSVAATPDPTRDYPYGKITSRDSIANGHGIDCGYKPKWPTHRLVHFAKYQKMHSPTTESSEKLFDCYQPLSVTLYRDGDDVTELFGKDNTSMAAVTAVNQFGDHSSIYNGKTTKKIFGLTNANSTVFGPITNMGSYTETSTSGFVNNDYVYEDNGVRPYPSLTTRGVCILNPSECEYQALSDYDDFGQDELGYRCDDDWTSFHDVSLFVTAGERVPLFTDIQHPNDTGTDINQLGSMRLPDNGSSAYASTSGGTNFTARIIIDEDWGLMSDSDPCASYPGYFYYSDFTNQSDESVYDYEEKSGTNHKCFKPTCKDLYLMAPDGSYFTRPAATQPDPSVSGGNAVSTTDNIAVSNNVKCYIPKWPSHVVYTVEETSEHIGSYDYSCYEPVGIDLYRGEENGGSYDLENRFTLQNSNGCTFSGGSGSRFKGVLGRIGIYAEYGPSAGNCPNSYRMIGAIDIKDSYVTSGQHDYCQHSNFSVDATQTITHNANCTADISNDTNYNNGIRYVIHPENSNKLCFMKPAVYNGSSITTNIDTYEDAYNGYEYDSGGSGNNYLYTTLVKALATRTGNIYKSTYTDLNMSADTGTDTNQKKTNDMIEYNDDESIVTPDSIEINELYHVIVITPGSGGSSTTCNDFGLYDTAPYSNGLCRPELHEGLTCYRCLSDIYFDFSKKSAYAGMLEYYLAAGKDSNGNIIEATPANGFAAMVVAESSSSWPLKYRWGNGDTDYAHYEVSENGYSFDYNDVLHFAGYGELQDVKFSSSGNSLNFMNYHLLLGLLIDDVYSVDKPISGSETSSGKISIALNASTNIQLTPHIDRDMVLPYSGYHSFYLNIYIRPKNANQSDVTMWYTIDDDDGHNGIQDFVHGNTGLPTSLWIEKSGAGAQSVSITRSGSWSHYAGGGTVSGTINVPYDQITRICGYEASTYGYGHTCSSSSIGSFQHDGYDLTPRLGYVGGL